jgi:hypothetical protein
MADVIKALGVAEVHLLADTLNACARNAHVRWLDPNGEDVREGVMRHVCRDMSGNFLSAVDDVRDGMVRISSVVEYFIPIAEFTVWLRDGYVAFDS